MKLNLTAPINQLGYGVVGSNIFLSLVKQGHDITLWPLSLDGVEEKDTEAYKKAIDNQDTYDKFADSIKIWHQFALAQHVGKGKHVGFPIFELNKFRLMERRQIECQDLVLVCSEWAKQVVLAETSQTNVSIVPLGVDRTIFHEKTLAGNMDTSSPLMKDLLAAKAKNTILLNVGKWEIRKGHDILADAFNDAFTNDSNVELWMCCENMFLTPEETAVFHDKYKKSPLGHKIRILPRLTGQRDLAIIMGLADVGVFPVRGEGWNLEALEMLSCGKHVIASDYSAHQEFLNQENADLIKVESLEPAYDGKWFFGQGEWAHLDINFYDSLVESLRKSLNKRDTFNKKGIETAIKYSWDNAASLLINSLS